MCSLSMRMMAASVRLLACSIRQISSSMCSRWFWWEISTVKMTASDPASSNPRAAAAVSAHVR